jgi:hypothetical protein
MEQTKKPNRLHFIRTELLVYDRPDDIVALHFFEPQPEKVDEVTV